MRTYEQALELGADHEPMLRGNSDMYVGMSALHREGDGLRARTWILQGRTEDALDRGRDQRLPPSS